jgi:hypothetical protein
VRTGEKGNSLSQNPQGENPYRGGVGNHEFLCVPFPEKQKRQGAVDVA